MKPPPVGLYVHFPWCVRKCPYCDFNSHPVDGPIPEFDYITKLLSDLEAVPRRIRAQEISSVFIGGGTPSLCSGRGISRLLNGVRSHLSLAANAEITLEANPGTVDNANFAAYRTSGVTRLSIGAQSFQSDKLATLGRIHGPDDIALAVAAARDAHFDFINIDLMHGLPQQTAADALADLEAALAFDPGHLSWYQLTLEPKTQFGQRPPILPVDAVLAEIETHGLALLEAAGYERYEVSAFARPGHRCRHNINYWEFGDYIGIGAGAHGKHTRAAPQAIQRTSKPTAPSRYMKQPPSQLANTTEVKRAERALEFMMNALRLTDGVSEGVFAERTGLEIGALEPALSRLRADGLMHPNRLAVTSLGGRFLDSIVAEFI